MLIRFGTVVIFGIALMCHGAHKSRAALLEDSRQRLDRLGAAQARRQTKLLSEPSLDSATPFDPAALSKARRADSDFFGQVSDTRHASWDGDKSSSNSGSSSDSPMTPDFKSFTISLSGSRSHRLSVDIFSNSAIVDDQAPCPKIGRIANATNQLRQSIVEAGYDLDESPSRRPSSPAERVIYDLHQMKNVVQRANSIEDSEEEAEARRVALNRWPGENNTGFIHKLHEIESKVPCRYIKTGVEAFKFGLICSAIGGALVHIWHKKHLV